MSTSTFYSPITGHKRVVHWWSKFAGRLGGSNNCVTLGATHILCADGDMNAATQAHEDAHAVTAEKRGIGYLPWVIVAFLKDKYAGSKAEREADDGMNQNRHLYTGLKEGD